MIYITLYMRPLSFFRSTRSGGNSSQKNYRTKKRAKASYTAEWNWL